MKQNLIRKLLAWIVMIGGALVVITARAPSVGLVGFILVCVGAALLVDD